MCSPWLTIRESSSMTAQRKDLVTRLRDTAATSNARQAAVMLEAADALEKEPEQGQGLARVLTREALIVVGGAVLAAAVLSNFPALKAAVRAAFQG